MRKASCVAVIRKSTERGPIKDCYMRKTQLTFDEAIDVWLRHWAGQFQHDIAADYGVNPGRVNEVLKERAHVGSKQIAASKRSA